MPYASPPKIVQNCVLENIAPSPDSSSALLLNYCSAQNQPHICLPESPKKEGMQVAVLCLRLPNKEQKSDVGSIQCCPAICGSGCA